MVVWFVAGKRLLTRTVTSRISCFFVQGKRRKIFFQQHAIENWKCDVPVSKSQSYLQLGSKNTDIFTIVEVDALIEQFEKDPSKKHAERLCRQMIDGNQDDITMKIDIYERLEKGVNPETKRWDVIWKKKHAQGLVDVLTQYLMSRVELD